ncbi:AzlC family ABC transporter permease [Inmirania thermothiophila]|uniref:Putative branched-subunit amino acid permease n=1 Tax=Inmirania thermothiophila TaxID=1750597 RepID=A0A3N1Y8X2_9GAMM|nr:AzlC family ABC transporter permease [Inmirania thermothiophila]ROR35200.1 putative branched-subunit amino acid permease [Inmirania thermothiophila]
MLQQVPASAPHFPAASLARGARESAALAAVVAAYGVVLGAIAAGRGLALGELLGMGAAVFAGAAQFVAVGLWERPLPVAEMVLAVAAVNLRYLLMSAALAPLFEGRPLWARLAGVHLVADENWAVTMAAMRRGGADPGFLLGGGLAVLGGWLAGCAAGHALGAVLPRPERLGLDFAVTAVFLCLLRGLWRDARRDAAPWLVAALASATAAAVLPGRWYVLAGALAGALVAAVDDGEAAA